MRGIRDNAAYEVFRLVILAIFLPLAYGIWRLIKQQPLQWGMLVGFVAVGLIYLIFALIKLRKKGAKFFEAEHRPIPEALLNSQIQELKQLQEFIGGKGETELWDLFDLHGITRF